MLKINTLVLVLSLRSTLISSNVLFLHITPLMLPISVWCAIANAVGSLKPGVIPKLAVPATPEAIVRAVKSIQT